jgi:ADP-ribose pyrophosphatase YjhB (NUDIX family)
MPEQIFQVGVKGLIRNSRGDILMVHLPAWKDKPACWDLPGGRMSKGETLLDTLKRELSEEIGTSFIGTPKQLITFVSNVTIPVGETEIPLLLVVYEVALAKDTVIQLDPNSQEDDYAWFGTTKAAQEMAYKFSKGFCALVGAL